MNEQLKEMTKKPTVSVAKVVIAVKYSVHIVVYALTNQVKTAQRMGRNATYVRKETILLDSAAKIKKIGIPSQIPRVSVHTCTIRRNKIKKPRLNTTRLPVPRRNTSR